MYIRHDAVSEILSATHTLCIIRTALNTHTDLYSDCTEAITVHCLYGTGALVVSSYSATLSQSPWFSMKSYFLLVGKWLPFPLHEWKQSLYQRKGGMSRFLNPSEDFLYVTRVRFADWLTERNPTKKGENSAISIGRLKKSKLLGENGYRFPWKNNPKFSIIFKTTFQIIRNRPKIFLTNFHFPVIPAIISKHGFFGVRSPCLTG